MSESRERISYEEFKTMCGERLTHDVLRPELGVMGATIVETWRIKGDWGTLSSETGNGGASYYRVPVTG